MLTIGTALIAVEHVLAGMLGRDAGDAVFHKGVYYAVFEVTLDAFGLAFLAGCGLLAFRRWVEGHFGGPVTLRRSRGEDIQGACGQLSLRHATEATTPQR